MYTDVGDAVVSVYTTDRFGAWRAQIMTPTTSTSRQLNNLPERLCGPCGRPQATTHGPLGVSVGGKSLRLPKVNTVELFVGAVLSS